MQFGNIMRYKCLHILGAVLLSWTAAAASTNSLPLVSPMFGSNMVMQRDKLNTIWGWAKPGEKVAVEIAGKTAAGIAGADGRWQVKIKPPKVGSAYTVKISDAEESVELDNVVSGDVWLCGGQSNMEFGLTSARGGSNEVKSANYPEMRLYIVTKRAAYGAAATPEGRWKVCSPETVAQDGWGGFSAVGYYFGKKLLGEIHVPIGLVEDCWGGTPAESWTSADTLHKLKVFDVPLAEVERLHGKGGPEYGNYITHWYDEYDAGQKGTGWAAPDFDDSDWKTVTLPDSFRELGVPDEPSVCYFRKTVELPDPIPAGQATIRLGVIERMDTDYVNGKWVGASSWVENPRVYNIPGDALKPGRNVVTIRVFKTKANGGFETSPDQLKIVLGDGKEISLAGEWKGKLSVDARAPHPLPLGFENWPTMPSVLYQGMIEPVAPLAMTGAIWYQGEANAGRAFQYRTLLPAMITDWRKVFGQGDFPFYIVSLPEFMQRRDAPGDDWWAEMREAQAIAARSVPNSDVAITIDTGEANDIHPKDKEPVGERLALCALAEHYKEKVVHSGPTFASVQNVPGGLKLHFKNTDGGLVVKGDKLGEFSVAGDDHKWYWADARIEGDAIIVSSPKVPEPKAARYAWQSNPLATLFNGAGLPAAPFRTDNWPGVTEKAKPY